MKKNRTADQTPLKTVIACPNCGVKLYATRQDVAYVCPKCKQGFQVGVKKKEKLATGKIKNQKGLTVFLAVFLGLCLRVVKNVLEEACRIKDENDLTV